MRGGITLYFLLNIKIFPRLSNLQAYLYKFIFDLLEIIICAEIKYKYLIICYFLVFLIFMNPNIFLKWEVLVFNKLNTFYTFSVINIYKVDFKKYNGNQK
jgi:hypothetical protein